MSDQHDERAQEWLRETMPESYRVGTCDRLAASYRAVAAEARAEQREVAHSDVLSERDITSIVITAHPPSGVDTLITTISDDGTQEDFVLPDGGRIECRICGGQEVSIKEIPSYEQNKHSFCKHGKWYPCVYCFQDAVAELERQRDEARRWIDEAVAKCAARRCGERDALLRDAERQRDELRAALIRAREDMAQWASYADEFFRKKWGLAADLAAIDAALEASK
jgi:hypothetical protein